MNKSQLFGVSMVCFLFRRRGWFAGRYWGSSETLFSSFQTTFV
ncbi:hypothetical protein HMPREF1051_1848 [Neisseria sicca VK64]|uniref:Uncharacterized protein n=1 Tax=Neisseria sicca VK64 TaxID=1095748 RepID=I2NVA3_NEISI|nr:hypothetical protein HMPREF1051_1848 [Neisseria sicca VK64]